MSRCSWPHLATRLFFSHDALSTGEELQLTERALRRNPKSYGAWNQRRWSVRQLGERADMGHELALCAKLLAADERNFHCWNYRRRARGAAVACIAATHLLLTLPPLPDAIRYIAYLASTPAADEVAFARAKIDANFSNYSAWHHRSSVLRQAQTQQLCAASGAASACDNLAARLAGPLCAPALAVADRGQPLDGDVLSSEFELVTQAFYTEPEDQAAWFYHDWLLDQALESARQAGSSGVTWGQARERLCVQAETCRQLRELEPSCRWPGLTLVHVLRAIMAGDAACGGGEAGMPDRGGMPCGRPGTCWRLLRQWIPCAEGSTQTYSPSWKGQLCMSDDAAVAAFCRPLPEATHTPPCDRCRLDERPQLQSHQHLR